MRDERSPWFAALQRWLVAWRSDAACAMCRKSKRPWRRLMWFPFSGTSAGAFVCSDHCWDRLADS